MEIVADVDRRVIIRFSDGSEEQLPICVDIKAAVQELQAVGVATPPSRSLWSRVAPKPTGNGMHIRLL